MTIPTRKEGRKEGRKDALLALEGSARQFDEIRPEILGDCFFFRATPIRIQWGSPSSSRLLMHLCVTVHCAALSSFVTA